MKYYSEWDCSRTSSPSWELRIVPSGLNYEAYIQALLDSDEWADDEEWQPSTVIFSGVQNLNVRNTSDGLSGSSLSSWNNVDNRNDNEFNNNETVAESIAGDSINQLDVRTSEDKIFYEKPKLDIQTVTYLNNDVLPPIEKCMNYVNSIKVSGSVENLLMTDESKSTISEVAESPIVEEKDVVKRPDKDFAIPEIVEDAKPIWKDRVVEAEVEVVELTTSVKEILQFPEIEDIPESGKSSEVSEFQNEDIVIDHIDLIREAKELTISEKSKLANITTIPKTPKTIDYPENNGDNGGYFEGFETFEEQPAYGKLEEIDLLSSIGRDIGVDLEKYVQPVPDVVAMEAVDVKGSRGLPPSIIKDAVSQDTNKLLDHDLPDVSSADTRKKEKMARNQARRRQQSHSTTQIRRPDKRRADHITDSGPGGFDVYNIETAMPKIDLDAIESHLRAAREEERRRRNDREEIRRRLAMGPDAEDLRAERGRKPSLQSRLQSGMNLQICFMNETPSDTESPGSENDVSPGPVGLSAVSKLQHQQGNHSHQLASRPQVLSLPPLRVETGTSAGPIDEADFFSRQARLQTEARMALAQAKEMAHMQMEVERQRLKQSPITEMVRSSLEKVGVQLGEDRRRLSRVLLTELNVAQLQVVANDLHARIAMLNEALVEGLLRRDDLHMEQDSMLVDVEDLTRYLNK